MVPPAWRDEPKLACLLRGGVSWAPDVHVRKLKEKTTNLELLGRRSTENQLDSSASSRHAGGTGVHPKPTLEALFRAAIMITIIILHHIGMTTTFFPLWRLLSVLLLMLRSLQL